MVPNAELFIRLTPGRLAPRVGDHRLNAIYGGPESLLNWIETQLGLQSLRTDASSRATEYVNTLERCSDAWFAQSLVSDRWATGVRLLGLRDELALAGWNELEDPSCPPLVRDMARAAEGHIFTHAGEPQRLTRILAALDDGQSLPPHRCILSDPLDAWPSLWRSVLDRLSTEGAEVYRSCAPDGSALRTAQDVVRGSSNGPIVPDTSFRYLSTRSETAACEYIVHALARDCESLPHTIVYCEDDSLAMRLDACLSRHGLPTMGSSSLSPAHPVMQVLPLLLNLLWEPVDPQVLLDFLTLPVSPIPKRAAYRLANSLTVQPGLGSQAWQEALTYLLNSENDPEGTLKQRIDEWLLNSRITRGCLAPTSDVRGRCSVVARWAAGRARKMLDDQSESEELILALQSAAHHASVLGELVEIQGSEISEPQLSRLLEETLGGGVEATAAVEHALGPMRVRSLAEIIAPCKRLVWLGLGTADATLSPWSHFDRTLLAKAAIELDDGSKRVASLRRAEAKGLAFVEDALLAVLLPSDTTRRWHPLWLAVRNALGSANEPIRLEDVVAAEDFTTLLPFDAPLSSHTIEPPPKERLLWHAPAGILRDREKSSASELQTRLACPVKWTLTYQARLYPSVIAQLPDSFLLKGSFCHSILQRVFGDGGELPASGDAVKMVAAAFDARLPLDAAPLAQPNMASERRRLRHELCRATETLVDALSAGGYRIAGIETEVQAQAFGKQLTGRIDCLAERHDGEEAIVDFKYAGRDKYRRLLADGRAVQLATYAHARAQTPAANGDYPAVAYLVLAEGQLFTPLGSALNDGTACSVVDGADMQTVWSQFATAIEQANDWLDGDADIPARPLQTPDSWPAGTEITLTANLGQDELQEACRYCDYPTLCGLRRLT